MKKHYVTFESPGTLFSETTTKAVESWDVRLAVMLAADVEERYGAKPYGFRFFTRLETDETVEVDGEKLRVEPKVIAESPGIYYLGDPAARTWSLFSLDELERAGAKDTEILRSNMRGNGWPIVIESRRSFKCVRPFEEADVVVCAITGEILRRGDEPEKVAYRASVKARAAS